MKIDYYYPELGLRVTLWAEKSGRFDALWWDKKQKLKEDIRLAAVGVLRPDDAAALAADPAKEAEPADVPASAADAAKKAEPARTPEGGDVIFGG